MASYYQVRASSAKEGKREGRLRSTQVSSPNAANPFINQRQTMNTYIGTKIIQAERQDRPDEFPSQTEGYKVIYEDGYESWSPKDPFEAAYLNIGDVSELAPHQQRVVGELMQLTDKVEKLNAFMRSDKFEAFCDDDERVGLYEQQAAMFIYISILSRRVGAFASKDPS